MVQLLGIVRKELSEIVRQPRLLVVMVLGPFLVLLLFAAGFDQQQTVLRTIFVGPADGPYEASVDDFTDELRRYVDSAGYSSDVVAATALLDSGEVDLIVVFPEDPADAVLSGEQATIDVLHDKIDPIAQTTVEVSVQVAVQELNATILETVVGEAQAALVPYTDNVDEAASLVSELGEAVAAGDDAEVARIANELSVSANSLSAITEVSESLAIRLGAGDDELAEFGELSQSARDFEAAASSLGGIVDQIGQDDVESVEALLDLVTENGAEVTTLDPRVIVRPFRSETANIQREQVGIESFFAPAAIALLLQHMVLTFAAMSLVSDRALGLFEVFRVGPVGPGRVLLGKFVSFLAIGAAVGAALFAALRFGLDIPMRGSHTALVLGGLGLLVAAIGLGSVLSLIARSDTQAVQYALLALLAGLFFGGFFLDLDSFRYPFKAVSWALPVTYGTNIFRDVMLRGDDPATADVIGLAAASIVYCGGAWLLLARRLRVT
jgi:ABC-2 type transport system permease protein